MVPDASLIINDIIMIPLLLFNINVLASFLILSDNLLFLIHPHEASTAPLHVFTNVVYSETEFKFFSSRWVIYRSLTVNVKVIKRQGEPNTSYLPKGNFEEKV